MNSTSPTPEPMDESSTTQEQSSAQASRRRQQSKSPSKALSAREAAKRETMEAVQKHEVAEGTLKICYTNREGRRVLGDFSPSELERCPICNRNQPAQFFGYHTSFEHGISEESARLVHPPAPHYNVPIPSQWQLERM